VNTENIYGRLLLRFWALFKSAANCKPQSQTFFFFLHICEPVELLCGTGSNIVYDREFSLVTLIKKIRRLPADLNFQFRSL
jgi:hypothetical protein